MDTLPWKRNGGFALLPNRIKIILILVLVFFIDLVLHQVSYPSWLDLVPNSSYLIEFENIVILL